MTARRLLCLGAAAGALTAVPALAHPHASHGPTPETAYEYAEPLPPVFESDPVVQPIPVPPSVVAPAASYETGHHYPEAPLPPPAPHAMHHAAPPMMHHGAPHVMHHAAPATMHHGAPLAYGHPGAPYPPQPAWAPPPQFDRDAWLDDCRARIRGHDRRERGGIIGGLLGAIGGGIVGNRAYDSERLAGTLIGAGVGGLAGLAIGAAIGAAADRDRLDECEFYLDRYLTGYRPGPGYGYPGYGYAYPAYAMTYVPVVVQVPQRAIVREYVTTEWVDVPEPATRTVTETRIIRQPAATKRIPVKPAKTVERK